MRQVVLEQLLTIAFHASFRPTPHEWLEGADTGGKSIDKLKNTAFRLFEYGMNENNTRFANFLVAQGSYSTELREKLIEWENVSLARIILLIKFAQ